jgi:16S rRNA (cytosine967-C5)-methyltransferase
MQTYLYIDTIPKLLVKPFSELVYQILSGERKSDKAFELFFKQNKITDAVQKKRYRDYVFTLIYNWYLIEYNFPTQAKNPLKLINQLNKQNKLALNLSADEWVNLGLPKFFYELLKADWPDYYTIIAESIKQLPPIYLRVNTLLNYTIEELSHWLSENKINYSITTQPVQSIKITDAINIYQTDYFKKGAYEQQDIASQLVSVMVNPQPGERVADCCAGNGGKTLHIANLMKNKGTLISFDVNAKKLRVLQTRLKKLNIQNTQVKLVETTKVLKKLHQTFDKVLIDAPCSGSGVYRRNPESKFYFTNNMLQHLLLKQQTILEQYAPLTKPGGKLVYATCSVLKCEGELQIKSFLDKHLEFELIEEKRIFPFHFDCDGFYIASLAKRK